ncbi:hypothetical protein JCM10908_006929 [Rhodotorula pacifica]|uniref:uncharacterized protein n=1 Tax=Rhodotorula pacifica TaxID=1495444 RepID=UPI00316CAC0C
MSSFSGQYAPHETSLFDEQMSAFEPSFTSTADPSASLTADPTNPYAMVDDSAYRPPSADGGSGIFQPSSYMHHHQLAADSRAPSPLAAYNTGAVAPFSQVYASHISPFGNGSAGAYPPPPTATSTSVPPPYPTYPAGVPPSSTLAYQAAIHQQQRHVQQHPGFLDPRQQAELLQAHQLRLEQQQQGGIAPATITPSQVQSFSIASTPSTSASPPPVASSSKSGVAKSSKTSSASSLTTKKANGSSSALLSASSRSKRPPSASPAPPNVPKYEYDPNEWLQILPGVRALLTAKRLQGAPLATAPKMLKDLRFFSHESRADSPWGDTSDVPPEGRAEVLHNLLKYAKEEFWRVLVEVVQDKPASSVKGKGKEESADDSVSTTGIKSDALELLQAWLEGASKSIVREKGAVTSSSSEKDRKRKDLEQATLALVLQVLAKLPVQYGHLIEFKKIPKRVKSISERAADGAVKSAAMQLVAKWQKVQERARSSTATATSPSSKRKAESTEVPAKKVKTSATPPPPSTTVKKATPAPAAAKLPLPSFKKAPPAAPAVPAFMAALGKIAKTASATEDSPSSAAQGGNTTAAASTASSAPSAPKKKQKKKVHWPEDDVDLCKYREIEARELPEAGAEGSFEEIGGEQHHLMEEQEGQTLTLHLEQYDEEWDPELDWYEPPAVEIPDTPDFAPLHDPKQSAEVAIQEAREAATMEVVLSSSTPPESPGEDLVDTSEAIEDDVNIKTLGLHPDLGDDPAFHATVARAQVSLPPGGSLASNDQITALLGQLSANGMAQNVEAAIHSAPLPAQLNPHQPPMGAGPPGPHAQPPAEAIDAATLEMLRGYDAETIRDIVARNPQFQAIDLSAIGVGPDAGVAPYQYGAVPQPGYPPPVQQPYQGYVPPGQQHQPQHGWGAPPPQNNYNGYQPPNMGPPLPMFGQQPAPVQVHPRTPKHMQNYKTQPCKYFRTQKGCDWGDRCRFKHE